MENSENKTNRLAALITYTLAVVFLILGLCLPLFDGKNMLAAQLPDVFNHIAGNKNIFDFGKEFTLNHEILLFGKGKPVDFMAWVMFLYALVTLFSVIALIPVGISYKKQGKALKVLSYVVETAAIIILSLYLIVALQHTTFTKLSKSLMIAFGGVSLMLIILSCVNKKRTGAAKLALFLLAFVSLLLLFDITVIIPKLAESEKFYNFADKLKISTLWYGLDASSLIEGFAEGEMSLGSDGISHLAMLFESNYGDALKMLPTTKEKTLLVLSLILAMLIFFNYVTDVIGLSSNAKKRGYIFNVVRYGLEILAIVSLFITVKVCKYLPGLLLCLILIVCAIQLAISIVRLVLALKRAKKERDEHAEELAANLASNGADNSFYNPDNYNASPYPYAQATYAAPDKPITDSDYKPVREYKPEPIAPEVEPEQPVQQPEQPVEKPFTDFVPPVQEPVKPAQAPTQQPPVHNVYTTYTPNMPYNVQEQGEPIDRIYKMNTVYQGPTDEFMRKLNNQEKIEFSMIFIEKTKGDIGKVPDYIIGGDNKKFFSSVFIYLGRMRSLVSDGLLNKMYKELNLL